MSDGNTAMSDEARRALVKEKPAAFFESLLSQARNLMLDFTNAEFGNEHPEFPRQAWRQAVTDRKTINGYWEWVAQQLEQHD